MTYHRDVVPILQANCQSCHRPGEVGPFSLLTYKQAVNWADDIKAYTQKRLMPPWKPAASVPFHNDRRMSDKDIATLAAWVDGGMPEGNLKDAPAPKQFPQGWQLGTPDLVLTASDDFTLGPTGSDVFRCFVLPTNLKEDVYVSAVEVRPSNACGPSRAAVHRHHRRGSQARKDRAGAAARSEPPRPRTTHMQALASRSTADRATPSRWALAFCLRAV